MCYTQAGDLQSPWSVLLAVEREILGGGALSSKSSIWAHYRLWLQLRPPRAQAEPLGAKAVKEQEEIARNVWMVLYSAQSSPKKHCSDSSKTHSYITTASHSGRVPARVVVHGSGNITKKSRSCHIAAPSSSQQQTWVETKTSLNKMLMLYFWLNTLFTMHQINLKVHGTRLKLCGMCQTFKWLSKCLSGSSLNAVLSLFFLYQRWRIVPWHRHQSVEEKEKDISIPSPLNVFHWLFTRRLL